MPRYLTRTELKKQRLEETRAKYPITFDNAYSLLYGSGFVAMSLLLMTLLAAATTVVAQSPPISVIGNPHGFTTGPPIPSCKADFHQGPPNDPLKGCKITP
jgi:cystathionine beta-lyase/cystathionine gamma-synthase